MTGPEKVLDVVRMLTAHRDQCLATIERLTAQLAGTPTMTALDQAEAELLAQLDDVRRRRTHRAALEYEYGVASDAVDQLGGVIERTPGEYQAVLDRAAAAAAPPVPAVPDPSARITPGPISPAALDQGGPLTTLTDHQQVEDIGPRHTAPRHPSRVSGAFRAITGRRDDDQDGDAA